jgi:hypothetical protein
MYYSIYYVKINEVTKSVNENHGDFIVSILHGELID